MSIEIQRIYSKIPENWTVDCYSPSDTHIFEIRSSGNGVVTIDAKSRRWQLGSTSIVDRLRPRYEGRNWLDRMVLDAVSALREAV